MSNLPPGVVAGGAAVYFDAQTLEELSKVEWARRRALQWRCDHAGEWPSVSQLMIVAGVGHGTAYRGLQRARKGQA